MNKSMRLLALILLGAAPLAQAQDQPASLPVQPEMAPAAAPVAEPTAAEAVATEVAPAGEAKKHCEGKCCGDKPQVSFCLGDVKFKVGLQYRVRDESRMHLNFADADGNSANPSMIGQRARFGLSADVKDAGSVVVEVQDVRDWGSEAVAGKPDADPTQNDYNADALDVHQAYGLWKVTDALSLKLGRQEINFDNERLVGASDWKHQGRAFDAALLQYQSGAITARVFFSILTKAGMGDAAAPHTTTKDFGGLHLHHDLMPEFNPSLVFLVNADPAAGQKMFTAGTTFKGAVSDLSYEGEFYYQGGDKTKAVKQKAMMFGANATYSMAGVAMKPTVGAHVDYLSGDDDATDDESKAFDTLFGTNHKFYGFQDKFLVMGAPLGAGGTAGAGLMDVGPTVTLVPVEKLNVRLDWHVFQTAEDTAGGEKALGNEFDLTVKYPLNALTTLQGGFSMFLPGKVFKDANADAVSEQWAYLMLNFQL